MFGSEDIVEDEGPSQLEIDENLSMVERIKTFCESNVSVQRLVHVRELAGCAEEIGAVETMNQLVPLLKYVANDPELAIRQVLAEQLVRFCKVLLSEPEVVGVNESGETCTAYDTVVKEVVPLLCGLLNASGPQDLHAASGSQVTESAAEVLIELSALLKPHDVGHTVLTAVLCLAHDNELEENRVTATQLLGSLASVVGRELCCQFVLPEVISLADDPVFRVRKAAALKLGSLCAAVGEELAVQRLLPVYEILARDEIWGVRKASLESLAEVAAVMPLSVRTGKLVDLFQDFHGDGSRWVRIAACEALGPFIATLPSDAISPHLVSLFAQLANPKNPSAVDSDISYFCAFNLPGVAQAVGAARWGELSEAFGTLAAHVQWKVRRTLAFSLHSIAIILGRELAEAELLSIFDVFLRDLDEVKVGIIQHLAAFLTVLSEPTRVTYLPMLVEIRAETDNWRFRFLLASQLGEFGTIFPRQSIIQTLVPLALDLCTDPVAEVRSAAVGQLGQLMATLLDNETSTLAAEQTAVAPFLRTICGMATMQSCYKRTNFVMMCSSLVRALHPPLVTSLILPHVKPLTSDRVAIVRLAVARLVREDLLENEAYNKLPVTLEMREKLLHDVDRDVLVAVHGDINYVPPRYRCKPDPPPSDAMRGDDMMIGAINGMERLEVDGSS